MAAGIRLLGGFEAIAGGAVVAADAWRLRKSKTLVKLLVLADGHRMHRDALVQLLWPDRTEDAGANNLHQVLYMARRAMAGTGVTLPLRDDVVLLCDGALPWIDVEAFDAACRHARQTRSPADYQAAIDIYRGDLLPEDRFEGWAEGPREVLQQRRLEVLMDYAEVCFERAQHAAVVELTGVIIAADPVHEGACRLLMRALAGRGRRYDALAAYDRLRDQLNQTFAADPEPATRRLYRELLTVDDLAAPAAASPTRSAASVAASSELLGPPPPAAPVGSDAGSGRLQSGLTVEHTSFIGREREMSEVADTLSRTRLLTLTGPGGAGKTRLACEVAGALAARYPDGVHLVEFASLTRSELVPHTVAAALEVVIAGSGAAELDLARHLADRRMLLVLDNCEHLLEACARLAAAVLRYCAGVTILATSREPLRIRGEVTLRTPSLRLPDLAVLPPLDRLARLESVRLFVDRARDVAPDFVLDAVSAPAVADICVRLDGMPLALELAAARMSTMAAAQLAARLGDALQVLDRGSRAALTRQQTLQATLAWSHDLLDADEAVLFRRLAVFRGSMSLEGVEAICGGPGMDALDVLSRLVDKSLVQVERVGGLARYRLLETIRQFADKCLRDAGEYALRARRHRDWFVALAVANDPELAVGVVNDSPEVLDAEHDNLRAALSTGLTQDPEQALLLARTLWRFWLARGDFSEASTWFAATLAAAPTGTTGRARALLAAAAIELRRGDPDGRQLGLGREAVQIMRSGGDEHALAQALHMAGLLTWVSDQGWRPAVEFVEESRTLAAAVGDIGGVASTTHTLGVIAIARGAAELALHHLERALELVGSVAVGPAFFLALTPGHFWEVGPAGLPRLPFTETVLLFRRVGGEQAIAYTMVNLAYAVSLAGDQERAVSLLQTSVRIFEAHGDEHGAAVVLCRLATVHRLAGDLDRAAALLERTMSLRRGLRDRRGIGITLLNQGLLAAASGDLGRADRLLRDALLRFEDMDDGPGRSGTLLDLGLILADAGDHDRARQVLREWHAMPIMAWTFRPHGWALLTLADLERRAGDPAAAARCIDEASQCFAALADEAGLEFLRRRADLTLSGP